MKLKICRLVTMASGVILAATAMPAGAYDWSVTTAHVTRVEASYMPDKVSFQIDQAAGSCAAGQFLIWNASGSDEAAKIANVQAIYALLLTAVGSGKAITLYGNTADCTVTFVHITSQN